MKKICVVILTISILFCSIALFPISVNASSDVMTINFYIVDNTSTPLYTLQMDYNILYDYDWSGDYSFYLSAASSFRTLGEMILEVGFYFPNSNSIYEDVSTYSFMNFITLNGDTVTNIEFNTNGGFISFLYNFYDEKFYDIAYAQNDDETLIYYWSSGLDLVLCYDNFEKPIDPTKGVYIFNLINGDAPDGDTVSSNIVYGSDITEAMGTENWECNLLNYGFGYTDWIPSEGVADGASQFLYMVCYNLDDGSYYYHKACELAEIFTISFMIKDGEEIPMTGNGIALDMFGITIRPNSKGLGFTFKVKSDYFKLRDIYTNIYNYNATVLYDSSYIRGSYLDFTVGFSLSKFQDGTLTGNIDLHVTGASEIVSFSYTFTIDDIQPSEFQGITFKLNQSYIDVPFNNTDQPVIYTGSFYPTDSDNILALYLISSGDLEEIKVSKSIDYIKDTENKLNQFNSSMEKLEDDKSEFKAEGGYRVNNTVNDLKNTMQSFNENAPQMNSIFRQVYDFPIVLTMLTLVLSVALISYVLYGKKG